MTATADLTSPGGPEYVSVEAVVGAVAQAMRHLTPVERADHLKEVVQRTKVHLEQARRALEHGKVEHFRAGSPQLPPPGREKELERASAPLPRDQIPDRHFHELRALDALVRTTRQNVVANPLWIAATHVEQSSQFLNAGELLMKDPTLQRAHADYEKAERSVVKTRRAKERYESKSRWVRALADFILGSGEKVRTDFDQAAHALLEAKGALEQVEREQRYFHEGAAEEHNAQLQAKQSEARDRREALEQPLRAAILERALAQVLVTEACPVRVLKDAPPDERLEVGLKREIRGFVFQEFRGESGTLFFADAIDQRATGGLLDLVPGDSVRLARTDEGLPVLELEQRGPNRGVHGQERLEGTVGAFHWKGSHLVKLEIVDNAGESRWVVPTQGPDLIAELGPGAQQALRAGNHVSLERGRVRVTNRERPHGHDR
jgi:hypothetical protein